jgi:UDP-N-acetylglucosamine 2-epimerase (non-hydrolysing)
VKVLSVFGTRPEAVKMAPVIKALAAAPGIESLVCVTAQHRQMLDQVLNIFDLHPDIDLNLMRPDQGLSDLTASIFTSLDPVLKQVKPDWILVQGDTTTVMAAALAGYYHRIRVGHVEAGLRTGDKWQPFPEEINRRVAGAVADLHFAPTANARQNLLSEGVPDWRIAVTGNPVIDALQTIACQPLPAETEALLRKIDVQPYGEKRLVFITAHRRENFGQPLEQICTAIRSLAQIYAGQVEFVYAVHLNPHVQEPVHRLLGGIPNVTLLPPLDYLPAVHVMRHSTLILTDSGGIQEEAPGFGIPVLVLREVTERPEGVEAGVSQLVGANPERIVSSACQLLDDPESYQLMSRAVNPFGDGHAAPRIVSALQSFSEPKK